MKNLLFFSAVFLVLTSYAQEAPPFATITSIEYKGTGCDAESARAAITTDLSYISILYDRFSAEIGQGTENPLLKQQMKNCAVIIKMDIPAGWSFQFEAVEYHGFVSLPNANTVATQTISAFSADGRRGRDFEQNTLRGPITDSFTTVYRNPIINSVPQGIIKAPGHNGRMRHKRIRNGDLFDCMDTQQQTVLKIRSRIAVRNLNAKDGSIVRMAIDSTDSSVQKLKINWNKCLLD